MTIFGQIFLCTLDWYLPILAKDLNILAWYMIINGHMHSFLTKRMQIMPLLQNELLQTIKSGLKGRKWLLLIKDNSIWFLNCFMFEIGVNMNLHKSCSRLLCKYTPQILIMNAKYYPIFGEKNLPFFKEINWQFKNNDQFLIENTLY